MRSSARIMGRSRRTNGSELKQRLDVFFALDDDSRRRSGSELKLEHMQPCEDTDLLPGERERVETTLCISGRRPFPPALQAGVN